MALDFGLGMVEGRLSTHCSLQEASAIRPTENSAEAQSFVDTRFTKPRTATSGALIQTQKNTFGKSTNKWLSPVSTSNSRREYFTSAQPGRVGYMNAITQTKVLPSFSAETICDTHELVDEGSNLIELESTNCVRVPSGR